MTETTSSKLQLIQEDAEKTVCVLCAEMQIEVIVSNSEFDVVEMKGRKC